MGYSPSNNKTWLETEMALKGRIKSYQYFKVFEKFENMAIRIYEGCATMEDAMCIVDLDIY